MIGFTAAAAAASRAVSVPVTDASSRYIDAPRKPSGASSAWPGSSVRRAPSATSACRCVEIVRRAGKSPPGGASRAEPRRASSGPSQQHRAAQPADERRIGSIGRDLRAANRDGRRADPVHRRLRDLSAAPPSPRRRGCAGTFSRTQVSSVRRQAATSGSAAFLFPSTSMPTFERPAAFDSQYGHG